MSLMFSSVFRVLTVSTRAAQFMINLMLTIFWPNWVISKPTWRGKCSIPSGSNVARPLKKLSKALKNFFQQPCHITSWLNSTFSFLGWLAYDQIRSKNSEHQIDHKLGRPRKHCIKLEIVFSYVLATNPTNQLYRVLCWDYFSLEYCT